MCGDVLGLLHGPHHVPVHGLEGGVVGGVRQVEDAGHLDRNIRVHLIKVQSALRITSTVETR